MNPSYNLASSDARNRWLHHPVLGDPSWDTFERESELPLFEGSSLLEWPVNGFLFLDPPSGLWHAYLSQYPRGYWGSPGDTRLLREDAPGEWCDLGTVLAGQPDTFDSAGGIAGLTVDPSLVFENGIYHLVYGWATPRQSDLKGPSSVPPHRCTSTSSNFCCWIVTSAATHRPCCAANTTG